MKPSKLFPVLINLILIIGPAFSSPERRQSRIVDQTIDEDYEDSRPNYGPHRYNPRPYSSNSFNGQSTNYYTSSVGRGVGSAHPDGDVLSGKRERPYEDPIGLRGQNHEAAQRLRSQGIGSYFTGLMGRSEPVVMDNYYLDDRFPPRTGGVITNMFRALLG